ncbi:hypothetical protein BGLA2_2290008 [Burkholderia gladioli]|nr:hypothetical protein BGLA2_2290008 [Burkholderia gladioli]
MPCHILQLILKFQASKHTHRWNRKQKIDKFRQIRTPLKILDFGNSMEYCQTCQSNDL